MNSHIRNEIIDNIKENYNYEITGDLLQQVLLDMFDRDVFLTQDEYDALIESGLLDDDKIYYIYEDDQ